MLFQAWLTKRFWYIHVPNKIFTLLYSVTGEDAWRLVIPAPHPTKAYAYRPGGLKAHNGHRWETHQLCDAKRKSKQNRQYQNTPTYSRNPFPRILDGKMDLEIGKAVPRFCHYKRNRYLWRIRNDVFANKIGTLLELHQTHVRIISLMPGKGIKS